MSDPGFGSSVYWEKQESALCGTHAINNLLQGPYYTEVDMSSIAHELDESERRLMAEGGTDTPDYLAYMAREGSQNVDNTGNFSLEVLRKSVEIFGLHMIPFGSDECSDARKDPTQEMCYIANYKSHWFSLRKLGDSKWYNLNSFNQRGPEPISDFYLAAYLSQLQADGYGIFVVRGTFPSIQQGVESGGRGQWFTQEQINNRPPPPSSSSSSSSSRTGNTTIPSSKKGTNKKRMGSLASQEEDDLARAIRMSLESSSTSSSSGNAVTFDHNNDDDDDDDEMEKALQATLAASLRSSSSSSSSSASLSSTSTSMRSPAPSFTQLSPCEDDDLKQAIALSMQLHQQNTSASSNSPPPSTS